MAYDIRHCDCGQQSLPKSIRGRCSSWCSSFPQNRRAAQVDLVDQALAGMEIKTAQPVAAIPGVKAFMRELKAKGSDAVDPIFVGRWVREACGCRHRLTGRWKPALNRPGINCDRPCDGHRASGYNFAGTNGDTEVEILS